MKYITRATVLLLALVLAACGNPGPQSPNRPPTPEGPRGSLAARFDFEDAVGLQLGRPSSLGVQSVGASSVGESGVLKVTEDGQLVDPLVEGELNVREIFIRNGRVYLLLSDYSLSGQPSGCALAEAEPDGLVTCVDADLNSIDLETIQFDDHGGIYYGGFTNEHRPVIRRSEGGVAKDYYRAPDATNIDLFLVTTDGTVLAEGETWGSMGSSRWVRAIEQSGYTKPLGLDGLIDFLPDGSLLAVDEDYNLRRVMLHDGLELDPRNYCCSDYDHELGPRFAEDADGNSPIPTFWAGLKEARDAGRIYRSADEVILLHQYGLYRLYPVAEQFDLPLTTFTNGDVGLGVAVVAGFDDDREPRAYTLDLRSGATHDMLGERRIDVLRLSLQLDRQRVMIYGLDLNRNQPVLAEYDLAHRRLEVADVERELAEDFHILDWNIRHVAPEPALWTPEPEVSVAWPGGWREGMVELDASETARAPFLDRYEWDFGDGTTATGVHVAHGFKEAGEYTVTLKVTNDQGRTGSTTETITILEPAQLVQVALSEYHGLALTASGKVFAFGDNDDGLLGDGTTVRREAPVAVTGLPEPATAVAVGNNHSLALTASGDVYAWGLNYNGQLGIGTDHAQSAPVRVEDLPSPVTQIAAAAGRSFALTSDGHIYAWGSGPLGDGRTGGSPSPVRVAIDEEVQHVSTSGEHTLALTSNGDVYAWGWNDLDAHGTGDATPLLDPTKVTTLSETITWVGAGDSFSVALTATGEVFTWGSNHYGELGDGSRASRATPAKVEGLPGPVTAVSVGVFHTLALTEEGELVGWGSNEGGRLGFYPEAGWHVTTPTSVGLPEIEQVAAGYSSSAAITGDGRLFMWGQVTESLVGSPDDWPYYTLPTLVR